ncbi:hypothetical protein [Albibacterium profundi]|uniref:Uncharacterized protein n=1 Tax=Albibacterium profundi TaxID=3134906 RepID=A0ABV5CGC5_9SPHI
MILFLLILILSCLLQLLFPWWVIAPVAFVCCLLKARNAFSAFVIAFLAVFVLWFATAAILSIQNNHILATRISQMFGLGSGAYSWVLLALLTSVIGGLVAGFAGISGFLIKRLSSRKY